jgi:hypothetical protein
MKYFLVLLLGISLVFSCRFIGGKRVRGNGNLETEQRSLSNFDGVVSHGSFDITVSTGDSHTVNVEADENLLEYIETEVDGGTLRIKTKRGFNLRPRSDIRITVTAPNFNELSSHGSGNIKGKNLLKATENAKLHLSGSGNIDVDIEAPAVDAEIAGSGNISVSGSAKEFSGTIHGSGDIRAVDMQSEQSKVEIAGSGNVEVFATNKLDIRIMGSGGVKYKGDAQVNTSIAGSGSVSKLN